MDEEQYASKLAQSCAISQHDKDVRSVRGMLKLHPTGEQVLFATHVRDAAHELVQISGFLDAMELGGLPVVAVAGCAVMPKNGGTSSWAFVVEVSTPWETTLLQMYFGAVPLISST